MNIQTARKIANDVGGHWADSDRRAAFHRLDMDMMSGRLSKDALRTVKAQMKNIWDWFGNRGVEGKA